jgi:hypothetical protein
MASDATLDPYVQAQIAARARPSVIKSKLLTLRSEYPAGLVLAIEGRDDKVAYSHWITQAKPGLSYEFLVCGGKRQVRQLKNALVRDLGTLGTDVMFIVDRDFDDLAGFDCISDVLMIERYSIENFVVDEAVVELSMCVAYPCNGNPGMREAICRTFREDYRCFLQATTELNRRIFVARRLRFDIDHLIPSSVDGLVAIKLGKVTAVEQDVKQAIPFTKEPSDAVLAALSVEFDKLEPALRYRGKFAIKFLTKWLEQLADEFRNSRLGLFGLLAAEGEKINHPELSLGAFASRSPIPAGLADFLP